MAWFKRHNGLTRVPPDGSDGKPRMAARGSFLKWERVLVGVAVPHLQLRVSRFSLHLTTASILHNFVFCFIIASFLSLHQLTDPHQHVEF